MALHGTGAARSGLFAVLLFLAAGSGRAQTTAASSAPLEAMPPDLETALALSALPPDLRAHAAVYRLDPARGYTPARPGSNGFTCIVERTEWNRAEFRNDIYTPLCYDAEGTRHQLKVWLDVAELRAGGRGPSEVKAEIERRFTSHRYTPPSRAGLAYMVAPVMRTYPSPDPADTMVMTMSMPHLMYYAPNLSPQDVGATRPPSPYPFILEQGPHGYMIQLVGSTESAAIRANEQKLMTSLCAYRKFLCLGSSPGSEPPS